MKRKSRSAILFRKKHRKLFIGRAISAAAAIILDIVFLFGYFNRTLGIVNAVSTAVIRS